MSAVRDAASSRIPLRALLLAALFLVGACGDDPLDPDPRCPEAPVLPFGRTILERLGPDDPVFDGSSIDYYSIWPEDAGTLTIEMAAEAPSAAGDSGVDPFLYLWTAGLGDPIAQAYDPTGEGPLRTARLIAAVTAGCYRVGASGWPSAAAGEYTIRADFTPAS